MDSIRIDEKAGGSRCSLPTEYCHARQNDELNMTPLQTLRVYLYHAFSGMSLGRYIVPYSISPARYMQCEK